jgi:hypothetical protein
MFLCHPVDLPFTAFQMLLSPGDRIFMSPLEDDAAFFGVLTVSFGPSWRNARDLGVWDFGEVTA